MFDVDPFRLSEIAGAPIRPGDAAQITAVVDFSRDRGLIVGRSGGGRRFGNTITLCPPLVITRAECDRIVDTLGQALATL